MKGWRLALGIGSLVLVPGMMVAWLEVGVEALLLKQAREGHVPVMMVVHEIEEMEIGPYQEAHVMFRREKPGGGYERWRIAMLPEVAAELEPGEIVQGKRHTWASKTIAVEGMWRPTRTGLMGLAAISVLSLLAFWWGGLPIVRAGRKGRREE